MSDLRRRMIKREALRQIRLDAWFERVVGHPDPEREPLHERVGHSFGWILTPEEVDAALADEALTLTH